MTALAAIVTGGARGIGHSITTRLLADGYAVGVVDVNGKALASLAPEIEQHGGRLSAHEASVSDRVAIQAVVDELQRGYTLHGKLLRPALVRVAMPAEKWDNREKQPS